MSKIGIIGASGYAGGHIKTEALSRGHDVISLTRSAANDATPRVESRTGSIDDKLVLAPLFSDSDVVIVAVHGAVDDKPFLVKLVPELLAAAAAHNTRLGFVGGAGSLRVAADGPRVIDTPGFPEQFKPEASAHALVLDALRAVDTDVDWFYVSPAGGFGSYAPGKRTGEYRTGDEVLVVDADGKSEISGDDFAIAILDEIEHPAHHQARFTVAY